MPKDNIATPDNDENKSTGFDLYSDDKTKEIVGSLFDEFVEDGGTNYFADYSDSFLNANENEEEESLGEGISRRRKRSNSGNKSIVFRKKSRKPKDEDFDEQDDTYSDEDIDTDAEDESNDLEKTIILPKLSNLFKKSDKDDDDDEIDEFFAGLTKDSAARAQAAAVSENEKNEDEDKKQPRRSKKIQPVDEDVKTLQIYEPAKNVKPQKPVKETVRDEAYDDEDGDDYEEKLVEINVTRIVSVVVLVIALAAATALAYKNHSYAKQLEEARSQITELQKNSSSTYETEIEELKNQVSELTAENESLKATENTASDPHTAAVEILNEAQSEITSEAPDTSLSQGATGGNTYTVKKGDTPWTISQSVYGNGADYQKILDANNLTESSVLNEGQVLTIPN